MGGGRWEMGDGGWDMEVEVEVGNRLKWQAASCNT